MTLVQLAGEVFGKAEALGIPHMGVGAIAAGVYGIPRATKDIDLLVSVDVLDDLPRLMAALDELATFDVRSEFSRRSRKFVAILNRPIWLPTAEDVVVQKLRWGRPKDLEDARDVLAVQGTETLDMPYIRRWCAEHGTETRLDDILASIPPM